MPPSPYRQFLISVQNKQNGGNFWIKKEKLFPRFALTILAKNTNVKALCPDSEPAACEKPEKPPVSGLVKALRLFKNENLVNLFIKQCSPPSRVKL